MTPRTLKIGRVEQYILDELEKGPIHMTLLDPENFTIESALKIAKVSEEVGSSAIMVGGSTISSQLEMDQFVQALKEKLDIPIIIFPNNVQALSRYADAVWYMVLLNSVEWYYVIGAQMQGALFIKRYGLEAIPMGYLVFGAESAVSAMGRALPLPMSKPKVVVAYALAAQYMGLRFVYLEAGSGALSPIPANVIQAVKSSIDIPLIVGGGIRSVDQMKKTLDAGADIVVTGTMAERGEDSLKALIRVVKNHVRKG
ncbi:MAG TPA: geranylgeranylglyceryl/heptaprenylglyceryl phosphate synthase [Nitrososphaeria archaeon]|nr:MAG: geranylgeranylglyceryl/heptaprenylglyceryl phosphate synthase [Nitrososphaerota archaeon]HDJ67046.1 geranylgeranylglyceryl/heptaprenylglyceryl phosphate synthase [Nitrososphaeria archaeon]